MDQKRIEEQAKHEQKLKALDDAISGIERITTALQEASERTVRDLREMTERMRRSHLPGAGPEAH